MELVILVVVLIAGAALLLVHISGGAPSLSRTFPGGFLAESMYVAGDNIKTVGSMYGFSMVSTTLGTPRIVVDHVGPYRLVAVMRGISLLIGDTGAIDMDSMQVQWSRTNHSEIITRSTDLTLFCPNWPVSNKFNMRPGRTADSDNWFEPNEQFELTICPSEGSRTYEKFSLPLHPDGSAVPRIVTRTVSTGIQQVMNLG